MKAKSRCWLCKQPYEQGYTIGLQISTNGGARKKKYAIVALICPKCAKSPGSRKTRRPLWQALRVKMEEVIAHIESCEEVLTNTIRTNSVLDNTTTTVNAKGR